MDYYTVPPNTIAFYASMGKTKAHKLMIKRGIPPQERSMIWQQVAPLAAEQRTNRVRNRLARAAWGDIITALSLELHRIRTSRKRKVTPNKARDDFLDAYFSYLTRLMQTLTTLAGTGESPKELAGRKGAPNEGAHWVDWVKPEAKLIIQDMYEQIGKTLGRTTRPPLSRVTTTPHFIKKVTRFREHALKALQVAETANDTDKIAQIQSALDQLDFLQEAHEKDKTVSATLPKTWQGLVDMALK